MNSVEFARDEIQGIIDKYGMAIFQQAISGVNEKIEENKERGVWESNCFLFGFKKEDYKKNFTSNGNLFEIYSFNPRARKYPLVARSLGSGKSYKFNAREVLEKIRKV